MKVVEHKIKQKDSEILLQTGKLASSASAAVFARQGGTCVLVTITVGEKREGIDFVPLQVEYVEKLYAGGKIKGSPWVKREGRPSDEIILKARLVDRSIRPLFPKDFRYETQVVITLLSVDGVYSPEFLSLLATSAAFSISPVPWRGPVAGSRVGFVRSDENQGDFILNPTEDEMDFSSLDLFVVSNGEKVVMIESLAEEISEEIFLQAVEKAKEANLELIDQVKKFAEKLGETKKIKLESDPLHEEKQKIKSTYFKKIGDLVKLRVAKDPSYDQKKSELLSELEKDGYDPEILPSILANLEKEYVRYLVLEKGERVDGRGFDEIRDLYAEVSLLPRTHGSGLFQRGSTQVLSIATLGSPHLEQLIESAEGQEVKRYMHHYYMPPYSVGEVGRIGFPSRREIGHGALAEKALIPVLPSEKDFPYTIRVVSEVLSSNGSTSMASVCGSTLALMDAGVPIKAPVAGIALGLFTKSDQEYKILTDIMGIEDFSGEMDFKIAGTAKGVTAVQLDVKNDGLTSQMIKESLEKGKAAREKILQVMQAVIAEPRKEVSRYAPKVVVIPLPEDKIGEIIGSGGKTIRTLTARTGAEIVINDKGEAVISGVDIDSVRKAEEFIRNMIREIEVGEIFEGEVVRLLPFGALVNLFPGKDGLIHVSNLSKRFVKNPADIVNVGDRVKVKVIQIDDMGRLNLRLLENLSRPLMAADRTPARREKRKPRPDYS